MAPRPRSPPPALADELVEEVLLRSPPDDPARLVRAALVCKRWCRLVSARAFRRCFRDLHHRSRPPPMLGFLCNDVAHVGGACSTRFVRTSASCPPLPDRRGWHALDARHGRVLLRGTTAAAPAEIRLAVWDPLASDDHRELPVPVLPRHPRSWNAALLCDAESDGPFLVVLVGTDPGGVFACAYSSSQAAAWSEPTYTAQHPGAGAGGDRVDAARAALVGNALYFVFQRRTRILKYHLGTRDMSVIHLPPTSHNQRIVLTTTEDGGLGFARMEGSSLCLWSMEARRDGDVLEWTRTRAIDVTTLLPIIDLLGFADGVGVFLVGTIDGFFSIDRKSGRINKVGDGPSFYNVVPYVSFYTPALGTASTGEGPSASA